MAIISFLRKKEIDYYTHVCAGEQPEHLQIPAHYYNNISKQHRIT